MVQDIVEETRSRFLYLISKIHQTLATLRGCLKSFEGSNFMPIALEDG
ncbi:MAG: hypothetical protein ACHBN1_29355 [Heteroscytonema crispum UTEX LB 1556]